MKRALALLLAAVTALTFIGCGRETAAPGTGAEPPTEEVSPAPEAEAAPEEAVEAESAEPPEEIDPRAQRLADIKKQIRSKKIGKYGMVPVYGRDVADGVYPVKVDSSSSFFRIADAELIVQNGEMFGRITIPSMSYLWVYPGTGREANKADKADWIGFEEVDEHTVFTIPVAALDAEIDCAAYSKSRDLWYDRKLVFNASSLPEDALAITLPDYEMIEAAIKAFDVEGTDYLLTTAAAAQNQNKPEPVSVSLPDGEYSIEVNMTGGSGRASLSSPTLLTVRGGHAYARLLWSSAYYDYMIIDNAWFYNLTTDGGNSTFEIPVTAMDEAVSVIADTTAMGDPLEIEYSLTFYSESIGEKGLIPQEAAKKVLLIAGVIILLGGVANYFVKKKRA